MPVDFVALRTRLHHGVAIMALLAAPAAALPTGAVVNPAGAPVSIQPGTNSLTINQGGAAGARSAINWTGFNISNGETVTFNGPGGGAALLNRVSGAASTIAGSLVANGTQLFIINPAGVTVSSTGQINASAGFVASTLDASDDDFLAGRRLNFRGGTGSITNAGTINAGGFAVLLSQAVTNSGAISVPQGRIALGGATAATLDVSGDGFLQIVLASDPAQDAATQVTHSGQITADGGRILLTGGRISTAFQQAVNVPSTLRARSVGQTGGVIELRSTVATGSISVRGSIDARGGGTVVVDGPAPVSIIGPTGVSSANAGLFIRTGVLDPVADLNDGGRIDISSASTVSISNAVTLSADGDTGLAGMIRIGGAYRYGIGCGCTISEGEFNGNIDFFNWVNRDAPALQLARTVSIGSSTRLSTRASAGGSINVAAAESIFFAAAFDTNTQNRLDRKTATGGSIAITSRGRLDVRPNFSSLYTDSTASAGRALLAGRNLLISGDANADSINALNATLSSAERQSQSVLFAGNLFGAIGENTRLLQIEASDAIRLIGNVAFENERDYPLDLRFSSGRVLSLAGAYSVPEYASLSFTAGDLAANNGRGSQDRLDGPSLLDARGLSYGRVLADQFGKTRLSSGTISLNALGGGSLEAPVDRGESGFADLDLTLAAPGGTIVLDGNLGARRLTLEGNLQVNASTVLQSLPATRAIDGAIPPSSFTWRDRATATITGTDSNPLFQLSQSVDGFTQTLLLGRLDANAASILSVRSPTLDYGVRPADVERAVFSLSGPLRGTDTLESVAAAFGYRRAATLSTSTGGYANAGTSQFAQNGRVSFQAESDQPAGYLFDRSASGLNASVTIRPRLLTVTGDVVLGKIYGDPNPALPGVTGVLAGDSPGLVQSLRINGAAPRYTDDRIEAGTYDGTLFLNGPDRLNYTIDTSRRVLRPRGLVDFALTVEQRPLTVTLLTTSATYGSAPPAVASCSFAVQCDGGLQLRWDAIDWAARGNPLSGDDRITFGATLLGTNGIAQTYVAGGSQPTNADTYLLNPAITGSNASNYRLVARSDGQPNILTVNPFVIRADVVPSFFYGQQAQSCGSTGCEMVPLGRPFLTVTSAVTPTPVFLEVLATPTQAPGTAAPAAPRASVLGISNGTLIASNVDQRFLPGQYTLTASVTGDTASNYRVVTNSNRLTVRKAIIGYQIASGTGEAIAGLGYVGTPPGSTVLNGVVDGDTVQLVLGAFAAVSASGRNSELLTDVSKIPPGDYVLRAVGLIGDGDRYELGPVGGKWGQEAAFVVRPPLSLLTLVAPSAVAVATTSGTAGVTAVGSIGFSPTLIGTGTGVSDKTDLGNGVTLASSAEAEALIRLKLTGLVAEAKTSAGTAIQLETAAGTTEIGTRATAGASTSISLLSPNPHIDAKVAVKLEAYVQQTIKGSLVEGVEGQGQGKLATFAGAEATTTLGIKDGKLALGTKTMVGAGASAGGSGSIETGQVGAAAGATVYSPGSFGIGFMPAVGVEGGKLSLGGDFGGAIGLGGIGFKFSVSIDMSGVADAAVGAGRALADLGSQIGDRISNFFTGGGSSGPRSETPQEFVQKQFNQMDPIRDAQMYVNAADSVFSGGERVADRYATEFQAQGINTKAAAAKSYLAIMADLKPLQEQQAVILAKLEKAPQAITATDMQNYQKMITDVPKLLTQLNTTLASIGRTARVDAKGNLTIVATGSGR
jgi:filamentous hemagglutinin family protein